MHTNVVDGCLLVALALGASGCGTSILLSYPLDSPFLRAHSEIQHSDPQGPPMVRTRLTLESGPLRVDCRRDETAAAARLRREESFDSQQRLVVKLLALGEALGAVAVAATAEGKAERWVAAGLLGADALGAGIYAFAAPSLRTTTLEQGPAQTRTSELCPPNVSLSAGSETVPVDFSGKPQGDVTALLGQVLQSGRGLTLTVAGRAGTWMPDALARCELAKEANHPQAASLCSSVSAPPPLPGVPQPVVRAGRITIEVSETGD